LASTALHMRILAFLVLLVSSLPGPAQTRTARLEVEGSGDDPDNANTTIDTTVDIATTTTDDFADEPVTQSAEALTEIKETIATTERVALATLKEMEITTADSTMDVITELAHQSLEGSRDSITASEDSEETVDSPTRGVNREGEGGEKCRKCSRSGWRARHASFCSDCQSQDEEKLRKRCEKCSRKGFAFRNIDFCETSCSGEISANEETEQVTTEEPVREAVTEELTTVTTEQVTEKAEESTTLMMTTVPEEGGDGKKKRGGEVRSQNRCKRCQRRGFYKRNAAFCDGTCDISLDEKIIRNETESNQKEASKARKEERRKIKNKKRKESKGNLEDKLGPLEELIKYLIQKNHGSHE